MNLGFQNLRPTYLKRTFFNCDTFSSYLFEVIFALLTFGDRGVRAGPIQRSKILWYAQNFAWVQNFIFPNGKHILPNSLINSWNSRKWNISFIMLRLKYGQPCVKSTSYFPRWNLNLDIIFTNSSIHLKVLNLGLRLYFQVFLKSQRYWKLVILNVALAGIVNFPQFMEKIEKWDFGILA